MRLSSLVRWNNILTNVIVQLDLGYLLSDSDFDVYY